MDKTKLKHTPGPWKWHEVYQEYGSGYIVDENGKRLAGVGDSPALDPENTRANGLVMAASSDLLDSLIELKELIPAVVSITPPRLGVLMRAAKAISKATGQEVEL